MHRLAPLLALLALSPPALAADGPEPVPVEIVVMPAVTEWVDAPFPTEAEAAGLLEGRVTVRVSIDAEGRVLGAEVVEPAGYGFDIAARDAVLRMRFSPAESVDGPVPATFDFAYGFRLEEVGPDPDAPPAINVDGLVREQGTRAPVAEALVTLSWAGDGDEPVAPIETTTDAEGLFGLSGVPAGRWTLTVLGPLHVPFARTVEVIDGEATNAAVWVKVDSLASNEIVVFGEREKEPEITRRTLTTQEIRRVPGTFGDPVKVIQTLPGAARSPFGTGLLIIRGANPEDSGVYVDGIRVPLIYHLTGTTSVIAPDLVESVDYLPGGYAAKFGRTSSGTIDVTTISGVDETKIVAGADILDAQAYVQTRLPTATEGQAWGVALGARRSYIDAFLPLFLQNSTFAIKPRYWDYQAKIFAPTPAGRRLSLFIYGFDDVLTVSTPEEQAQGSDQDTQGALMTRYNSHRFILRWDEKLSDDLELRVVPSLGVDTTLFGVGNALTFDGSATNFQLRAELGWTASPAVEITPGIDLLSGTWSFGFQAPLSIDDLDNPIGEREPVGFGGNGTATYPDTWLRMDLRPLEDRDRLLITPSVRLGVLYLTYGGDIADGAKPFVATAVDPRLAARFEIVDGFAVKGSSGLYHQPPQPQESIGVGATPDLLYERAWNSSLGLEHEVNPSIQWEAEVFLRQLDRLIDVNDDFAGFGTQPFANVGLGRAYGLEVIARHQPTGRFFGWVSYTLSRSERRASADADWTAFDFDQTHIMSAQAGYDLPKNWGVSFQVQYVTGNPDTPLNAGVFDADQGFYNGFRVGAVNGERLPDFFQTSFRVDKTFVFKSWELSTYLDLLNTVRGVNPEFTLYNYDFSESAYVRGLPFIPNLGLEARIRR
jgi:TonB family protein